LFLPLGSLLAALAHHSWRSFKIWPRVLLIAFAAAAFVEFAQLFVESRSCDTTDVLFSTLAAFSAWALTLQLTNAKARLQPGSQTPATTLHNVYSPYVLPSLIWTAIIVFTNWQPFNFRIDVPEALRRLAALSPVPFADYQQASITHALDEALHKFVLFLPLGVFLDRIASTWARQLPLLLVVFLIATFALFIEFGQVWLPTRYPSVTDVLIETCGGALGCVLSRRIDSTTSTLGILER